MRLKLWGRDGGPGGLMLRAQIRGPAAACIHINDKQELSQAQAVPLLVGEGLVAEVPSKFARVGGSRPDFGPEKSKKTHKNPHKTLIKSKLNQK